MGVNSMKRFGKLLAVSAVAAMVLTGCGGVSEEMLAERESAINMMENGDYEGAVAVFNELVADAESVTDFELDILKYRAEAEYLLGDYAAAAYSYDILNQVDEERAEYCYFSALSYAKSGDIAGAQEMLEKGKVLDGLSESEDTAKKKKSEETDTATAGYMEAMIAIGNALSESGDKTGAGLIYDEVIQSGFATTEIYNRLMRDSMENGDYVTALDLAGKGLELSDGLALRELKFNEAVCYEYLGNWEKALTLFESYVAEFGSDEKAEHEIAFLKTR